MADVDDHQYEEEGQEQQAESQEVKYEHLTPEQIEEVKDVFEIFDKENNQTIEKGQLSTVLRWLKFNPTEREI